MGYFLRRGPFFSKKLGRCQLKRPVVREFLKVSATAGLTFQLPKLGMTMEDRQYKAKPDPLIDIQIAPFNLLDEGVEFCLDILQEAGAYLFL
jgi:hypothetical protein